MSEEWQGERFVSAGLRFRGNMREEEGKEEEAKRRCMAPSGGDARGATRGEKRPKRKNARDIPPTSLPENLYFHLPSHSHRPSKHAIPLRASLSGSRCSRSSLRCASRPRNHSHRSRSAAGPAPLRSHSPECRDRPRSAAGTDGGHLRTATPPFGGASGRTGKSSNRSTHRAEGVDVAVERNGAGSDGRPSGGRIRMIVAHKEGDNVPAKKG